MKHCINIFLVLEMIWIWTLSRIFGQVGLRSKMDCKGQMVPGPFPYNPHIQIFNALVYNQLGQTLELRMGSKILRIVQRSGFMDYALGSIYADGCDI